MADDNSKLGKEPTVAHPPGFKQGDDWNSEDARKAYLKAGTSFDEVKAGLAPDGSKEHPHDGSAAEQDSAPFDDPYA